jgi:hypothetical protein
MYGSLNLNNLDEKGVSGTQHFHSQNSSAFLMRFANECDIVILAAGVLFDGI